MVEGGRRGIKSYKSVTKNAWGTSRPLWHPRECNFKVPESKEKNHNAQHFEITIGKVVGRSGPVQTRPQPLVY